MVLSRTVRYRPSGESFATLAKKPATKHLQRVKKKVEAADLILRWSRFTKMVHNIAAVERQRRGTPVQKKIIIPRNRGPVASTRTLTSPAQCVDVITAARQLPARRCKFLAIPSHEGKGTEGGGESTSWHCRKNCSFSKRVASRVLISIPPWYDCRSWAKHCNRQNGFYATRVLCHLDMKHRAALLLVLLLLYLDDALVKN